MTSYGYDDADRTVSITYPDGEAVATTFSSRGLPLSLTGAAGTLVDAASYDMAGRLLGESFPAGGNLSRTQSYYPWTAQAGALQGIQVGGISGTVLDLDYTYDPAGNLLSLSDHTPLDGPPAPPPAQAQTGGLAASLSVTWTAASDPASGVAACALQYESSRSAWTSWQDCTQPGAATFTPADPTAPFGFRSLASDHAGNSITTTLPPAQYDHTPPVAAIAQPQSGAGYTVAPAFAGTAADSGGSGLQGISLTLQGPAGYWDPASSQWSLVPTWFPADGFVGGGGTTGWSCTACGAALRQPGNNVLQARACDAAGNCDDGLAGHPQPAALGFAYQHGTDSFGYDALNRLTSAYGSRYAYDALGRVISQTTPGGDLLGYQSAVGHVHAVGTVSYSRGGSPVADGYGYDGDGNLAWVAPATGPSRALTWDAENRLAGVSGLGAVQRALRL